jgi:hypothetical protein
MPLKPTSKLLPATLTLIFMLLTFGQLSVVQAESVSVEDKALAYVENVLPIDMSLYTIKSLGVYEPAKLPNSTVRTESVSFTLTSSFGGQLFANCMFNDGVQYSCSFQGSPISDKQYESLAEEARIILERHKVQTGVDTTKLARMLDFLNLTAIAHIVRWGNLELGFSNSRLATGLKMINGALHVDPTNTIGVTSFNWAVFNTNGTGETYFFIDFSNGVFHSLYDWHTVGQIETSGSPFTVKQFDNTPLGNAPPNGAPADTELPQISNLSIENKTYNSTEIPLEFRTNENVTSLTYSLDDQANLTLAGNTTLSGLSDGPHCIIVYATDSAGNVGASENVAFTIATETQQAAASDQKEQGSLELSSIEVGSGITVFAAGLGVLLYSKKRTKKPTSSNSPW